MASLTEVAVRLRSRRLCLSSDECGATGTEYALVLTVVSAFAFGILLLGGSIQTLFGKTDSLGAFNPPSGGVATAPRDIGIAIPPDDGTVIPNGAGNENIPAGTVWFNTGAMTAGARPGLAGAYTNAPVTGSCSFTVQGYTYSGTWITSEPGFSGPGISGEYSRACVQIPG